MSVNQKAAPAIQYDKVLACFLWCLTFFTLCTTLLLVYRSRTWGLLWDSALWHNVAWLITEGAVPYRDIFDVNFPGTYLIHLFVLKYIGSSDMHWRLFDLLCLVSIGGLIVLYCRRFGRLACVVAVALFSAFHLYNGPLYMGQRDYILLVFLLGAVNCIALVLERRGGTALLAAGGLLMGAMVSIKPYGGLMCFFLLIFIVVQSLRAGESWIKNSVVFTLSCCVVPAALMLWLWYMGGLAAFFDILFNYLVPFYSKFKFQAFTRHTVSVFLGMPFWEIAAIVIIVLAGCLVGREYRMRRLLLAVGMFYGFFHFYFQVRNSYQLYPFVLFMFLCIASWAGDIRCRIPVVLKCAMAVILIHVCILALYRTTSNLIAAPAFHITRFQCTESLVNDLKGNVGDGQTVQVMDSISGGVHALYILQIKQPTRFIYDSHLFHDIDAPYIQNLRAEFISDLRTNPPAFLVLSATSWPLAGYERLDTFPELAEWLSENYEVEIENDCYRIYRKSGA